MPVLVERFQPVVGLVLLKIRRRIEYLRERLEEFIGIYRVSTSHVYTAQEEMLIQKTAEVLREYFPQNPARSLLEEDFESRCEALESLGQSLTRLYELDGVEVIVTDDPELFPEDSLHVYGRTDMRSRKVYINAQYLLQDDAVLIEHSVATVLHELRHMVQYQVMTLEKTYGVPYERRCAWRWNVRNYIKAEFDLEGYSMQPIEFDARNFVNRVWRSLYSKGCSMTRSV